MVFVYRLVSSQPFANAARILQDTCVNYQILALEIRAKMTQNAFLSSTLKIHMVVHVNQDIVDTIVKLILVQYAQARHVLIVVLVASMHKRERISAPVQLSTQVYFF